MDYLQMIDALPQRQHIKEEDIQAWIEQTRANGDNHDIGWHIKRLNGFGGSEIGALALNYQGLRSTFTSHRQLVRQKLMQLSPEPPDLLMRRGTLLEPTIAEIFMTDFHARRDYETLDALAASNQRDPDHPWARVFPDDVVLIGDQRVLVDYKAPTEPPKDGSTCYEYACQVHLGKHITENVVGTHIDFMLVVYYDHAIGTVRAVQVDYDPQMHQIMMEAGDHYWDMVLNGQVPEYLPKPEPETIVLDGEAKQLQHQLIDRIGTLALLKKQIDGEIKKAAKELTEVSTVGGLYEVDTVKGIPLLTPVIRRTINEDQLSELLSQNSISRDQIESDTNEYDGEAMAELLVNLGREPIYKQDIDKEKLQAVCEQEGLTMPEKISVAYSLRASKAKGVSKAMLEEYSQQVTTQKNRILTGLVGEEALEEMPAAPAKAVRAAP